MDNMTDAFFLGVVVIWLLLQIAALWSLEGVWRKAAWASALAMALAIAAAALGVLSGSNIAPLWVVLAFPLCLIWIAGLWIARATAWAIAR